MNIETKFPELIIESSDRLFNVSEDVGSENLGAPLGVTRSWLGGVARPPYWA